MIVFTVEKGVNGILCALFYSFTNRINPDKVVCGDKYQTAIYDQIYQITATKADTARVQNALTTYAGKNIISELKKCLCLDTAEAYTTAFNYAKKILLVRAGIKYDYSCPEVWAFTASLQKVEHEIHRMYGFVRFMESENGILYAQIAPDNDIAYLIAPHFLNRLGDCPFIIHDLKRGNIAISNGKALKFARTTQKAMFTPSEQQLYFEQLWKKYYKSINIDERKNERAQNNFMPKKYRPYMSETHQN